MSAETVGDKSNKILAESLLSSLSLQRSKGQFCDVQLTNGSSKLWAHSCILSIVSPFMLRYFTDRLDNSVTWSVNYPLQLNISAITKCWEESKNNCMVCLLNIVDYIYTGKIKLTVEHVDHVVNLSNNLELDDLLFMCQTFIHHNVNWTKIPPNEPSENTSTVSLAPSDRTWTILTDTNSAEIDHPYNRRIVPRENMEIDVTSDNANFSQIAIDSPMMEYDENDVIEKTRKVDFQNITKSNGYDCDVCGFKSLQDEHFLIHDFAFHRSDYTCLTCNFEDGNLTNLLDHLELESHDRSICSVCLFQSSSEQELRVHLQDHRNEQPFKCSHCSLRFKERNDWLKHFSSNCDAVEEDNNFDLYSNKRSCSLCKFSFPSEEMNQKHSRIFHKNKYSCLSCVFNTYKIEKLVTHLKIMSHSELLCSLCLYESKNSTDLKTHLEEHLEKLPFKCTACFTRYPHRRQWWRHMASHFSEKPFRCDKCPLAFKTTVLLNTHVLRMHRKKRYVCNICGVAAPFPSLLEKHQRIHKTRPEYVCSVDGCSYKTNLKNQYIKHKREHVIMAKTKPQETKKTLLECSICKLTFSLEKNMKRHIKLKHNSFVHSYQCPRCVYNSVRLDKIREHCSNVHNIEENQLNEIINSLKTDSPQFTGTPTENIQNEENTISLPDVITETAEQESDEESVAQTIDENSKEMSSELESENNNNSMTSNRENSVLQEIQAITNSGITSDSIISPPNRDQSNNGKKTLFLNKTTGEINIFSGVEGIPIPIASVTSTNLLTIGNFREGTGSVTLNEATGVLTLNNINRCSTGAVFLNESTGELSYIDLNSDNPNDPNGLNEIQPGKYPPKQVKLNINDISNYKFAEKIQLDEVTGEIIKVDDENVEQKEEDTLEEPEDLNFEDFFDFDIENFNEDSFDGFDDFDELLFDNLSSQDNYQEEEVVIPKNTPIYNPGAQTPRLDESTGELIFDEASCNTQDIWNELKPFRDVEEVGDDSILENVNSGSYNFLLNEITGEFYK